MYGFIKTFIISFLFPLPLCLGILLTGLIFLWITTKQKTGKILVSIGFSLLAFFSFPLFPNLFLGHLEQQHAPFTMESNGKFKLSDIEHIVVLAGGHVRDPRLPITSQFSHPGLVRLIEGIRLYHKNPGTKLILSGGLGRLTSVSDAELMSELAATLGIPKDDIILEPQSMSTFEEAMFIKPIVKSKTFLLVTSSNHMPRAMALFRKQGMNPIPAPTGHLVKRYGDNISVMPDALDLHKSDIMIRELLGLIKEKLMGRI